MERLVSFPLALLALAVLASGAGAQCGGPFGPQDVISTTATNARDVQAADIDGDGDADVLSAFNEIAWYENTDGKGTFGPQQNVTTTALGFLAVFGADLDGDGDTDAVAASGGLNDVIVWFENTAGDGTAWSAVQTISAVVTPVDVFAIDLDADGDLDVLSAGQADTKILWHENAPGTGTGWIDHQLSTSSASANSVHASDLDGDGDPDLVYASFASNTMIWYQNLGGGSFGPESFVSTAIGPESVFATDLSGDGLSDVLVASSLSDTVAWYENLGGGVFGAQQIISTAAVFAFDAHAADLDGDGDNDVLSASGGDDKIAWYENLGGGSFGSQQEISTAAIGARSVYAEDLDGDGNADVLSASLDDDKIAWYENLLGPCLTGPTPGIVSAFNIATVDNATPGGFVWLGFSLATGSTTVGTVCPGLTLDLDNPTPFGPTTADPSGQAFFGAFVPASLSGKTVFLQAGDVAACEVSNLVSYTFP